LNKDAPVTRQIQRIGSIKSHAILGGLHHHYARQVFGTHRVWLAADCDREGQLIGQEILEHYKYRGQVMRVLFTAQDSQTIRDAFDRAKPNAEYARLYAAAVARRADQIYNLSLTRTATVILGQGARRVIKTPTLAIVCKRELEIRSFVPLAYFEVVATAKVAGGQFQMRHAPQDRIVKREIAEAVANSAQGFAGALAIRVEDKRQGPPKLHDLPSLQKLCSSRFGWPASKTLKVAQELYDGQGKKVITYPRAEVRYLPQSLISDVPRIVAGLRVSLGRGSRGTASNGHEIVHSGRVVNASMCGSVGLLAFGGLYRLALGVLDALKIVRPETLIH
jgi:DNA topoisomerase-3